MHTVELMERAISVAQTLGYGVRQEWLGGVGGGACEIAGRKWIFLDISLTTMEQFEQLASALESDPATSSVQMPDELSSRFSFRKSA